VWKNECRGQITSSCNQMKSVRRFRPLQHSGHPGARKKKKRFKNVELTKSLLFFGPRNVPEGERGTELLRALAKGQGKADDFPKQLPSMGR